MRPSKMFRQFSCVALLLAAFQGSSSAQSTQSTPAPTATAPPPAATPELVIDQIKKAVVFLKGTYQATVTRVINGVPTQVTVPQSLAGTGFFIYANEPRLGEGHGIDYLVTNKHMIRQPSPAGVLGAGPYFRTMDARVNTVQTNPDGTQFATLTTNVVDDSGSLEWFVDDTDDTVDLAVTPVVLDKRLECIAIPTDIFATKELFTNERVNENDEVIFAGLFAWNPGAMKNYPIVRHGKLARLSGERIPLDRTNP